jgi:hypothetical protein
MDKLPYRSVAHDCFYGFFDRWKVMRTAIGKDEHGGWYIVKEHFGGIHRVLGKAEVSTPRDADEGLVLNLLSIGMRLAVQNIDNPMSGVERLWEALRRYPDHPILHALLACMYSQVIEVEAIPIMYDKFMAGTERTFEEMKFTYDGLMGKRYEKLRQFHVDEAIRCGYPDPDGLLTHPWLSI